MNTVSISKKHNHRLTILCWENKAGLCPAGLVGRPRALLGCGCGRVTCLGPIMKASTQPPSPLTPSHPLSPPPTIITAISHVILAAPGTTTPTAEYGVPATRNKPGWIEVRFMHVQNQAEYGYTWTKPGWKWLYMYKTRLNMAIHEQNQAEYGYTCIKLSWKWLYMYKTSLNMAIHDQN